MKVFKEVIWHFTCEECQNWWSYATSEEWKPYDKYLTCPHCNHIELNVS